MWQLLTDKDQIVCVMVEGHTLYGGAASKTCWCDLLIIILMITHLSVLVNIVKPGQIRELKNRKVQKVITKWQRVGVWETEEWNLLGV